MRRTGSCPIAAVLTLAAGCSSVGYVEPDRPETSTIDGGAADLRTISGDMVEALSASPALAHRLFSRKGEDKRVILYVGDVENLTSELVDTRGITDEIRTHLLATGRFRFVAAGAGREDIDEPVRFRQGSGGAREDRLRRLAEPLGADMVLHGSLRSIDPPRGSSVGSGGARRQGVHFQLVLRCVDIDTAETVWQEEAELRRTGTAGLFVRS